MNAQNSVVTGAQPCDGVPKAIASHLVRVASSWRTTALASSASLTRADDDRGGTGHPLKLGMPSRLLHFQRVAAAHISPRRDTLTPRPAALDSTLRRLLPHLPRFACACRALLSAPYGLRFIGCCWGLRPSPGLRSLHSILEARS